MGKQILSAGKAQLFKDSPALMISDVESTGSVDSSRECMFTVPETNATSPETESPGTQTFSDDEPSPNRTPLLSIAMVHDDCTPRTQPRSRFGEREGRVHSMLPPPQQHLRPTPAIKRGLSTPAAGAVKKPGVTFLDGFFEKVTSSPRPRMARTPTLEPLADMLSEVHKSAATISKLQRENRELTAQLHAERAVTQHLVEAQANNAFQARSMFTFAEWKCRDAVLQQEIAAFRAILSRFDNDREYCRSHSRSSMAGTHPVPAEMHHGDEAIAELTRIVGQAAAHGASVRSHQTEFTISELETQLLTAHGELRRKDVEIRGLEREIDTMKEDLLEADSCSQSRFMQVQAMRKEIGLIRDVDAMQAALKSNTLFTAPPPLYALRHSPPSSARTMNTPRKKAVKSPRKAPASPRKPAPAAARLHMH